MHENDECYTADEVRFFGQVVASAAHEWGNILAVINESAGLLQDLVCLAGRGVPLDPERLAGLAATVTRQIHRGNDLLGNLRELAHTVDTTSRTVHLGEAGAVMTALAGRLASQHDVTLTAAPAADDICLTCDPYRLSHVLYASLCYAISAAGAGANLEVSTALADTGPILRVHGLPSGASDLPDEVAQAAQPLGATVRTGSGCLEVLFPKTT